MLKDISSKDISEFFFLFTVFLLAFEPAIFVNHAYRPIFIYSLGLGLIFMVPSFLRKPREELSRLAISIRDSLLNFYPLIPLIAYIIFDLASLAWTNNDAYIVNKYRIMVPLIVLLIYGIYHFYDRKLSVEEKLARGQRLVLSLGICALVLALIVHLHLMVYGRTYFILRTSLQFNYNRFAQSLMLGYFAGIYLISRIENKNKYIIFVLYSVLILPLLYTSGSRRFIIMYIPAFLFISIPFIIEGIQKFREDKLAIVLAIFSIGLVLLINNFAIGLFMDRSLDLYNEIRSDLENNGEDYPSAMERPYPGIVHPFRKEQPLTRVQGSIGSGEAANQRAAIYDIVTNRLDNFTRQEWIRGAGGSEQYDVFQSDYAKRVMEEEGIDSIAHPHSFIFIDLLNGGIIKLAITLIMVLASVVMCLKFGLRNYRELFFLGAYGIVYIANELINSSWGLQENRLTWVFFLLIMGLACLYGKNKDSQ